MEEMKKYLEPGEALLWCGPAAENVSTLDATHKRSFLIRVVAGVVLFAALTALYIVVTRRTESGITPAHIVVIALLCAFIPLRMFLDLRMLRKTNYAVTDRRIIAQSDRVLSVALDRIREAVIRTDDEGRATLLCGRKAVSMPPRKWRVAAIVENSAEGDGAKGECPSFVLYAPGDMEGLRKALGDRIPLRSA